MRSSAAQQIAHDWAHQRSSGGRSSSSSHFFFEGKTIYSYGYHFPIATLTPDGDAVFFTLQSYSNTTAKHISYVRSAVSHMRKIFVVNVPDRYGECKTKHWQEEQLEHFTANIKQTLLLLAKARKPQGYMDAINEQIGYINDLAGYLKFKLPAAVRKLISNPTVEVLSAMGKKELDAMARRQKAEAKARAKREAREAELAIIKLAEWKGGKDVHTGIVDRILGNTYLRVSPAGDTVETSKGISIPVPVAKRYYETVSRIIASGKGVIEDDCTIKMMDYCVKEITPDHLLVGCHDIPMSEINEIAKTLCW